ncbi:MAG: isopentenyl-diphosphate Delta-isomerase [Nitrospiraceae bacterium]|nr:isopentenyl-diphosphate Delta-isomerase [Nitrospiraceae bacterium]
MKRIVMVDEDDNPIGLEEKEKCHEGDGILHRAFLGMVFNDKCEILLARRGQSKKLWPGWWDGTVASHPSEGESYEQAVARRLREELGIEAREMKFLFKFRYQARYGAVGSENELCAVLAVRVGSDRICPNPEEVSEVRFADPRKLAGEAAGLYCPWFLLALENIDLNPLEICESFS